jgi:hypothetical protein
MGKTFIILSVVIGAVFIITGLIVMLVQALIRLEEKKRKPPQSVPES